VIKKLLSFLILNIYFLSACTSVNTIPTIDISESDATEYIDQTGIPVSTLPATIIPSATIAPVLLNRPVFLAWPLPAYIGTARISQYPNTPWTWHYLGLNEGYQCPPMFGYLLNLDSLPYWRDVSIPEEQDEAQADPHQFEMVECYSTDSNAGANGHEGTDIKAPAGTPVLAAADGKVQEWRLTGLNSMVVLKHCLGGSWDANHQCAGGKHWYTTYMHIVPDGTLLQENKNVAQGEQLGTIYDQTINSHLHFEVGLEKRSYTNYVNPWGDDEAPWLGCMWLDQSICVNPDPAYKRMALQTDTQIILMQGDIEPVEIQAQNIQRLFMWGDRIGVLDSRDNLLIRDGKYDGHSLSDDLVNWKIMAENVLDFQVTDKRIAVLDRDRNLFVQENNLDGSWKCLAENVTSFSVSNHRIGFLTEAGDLFVMEGDLGNDWVPISNNVLAFQVIDNRIAVVDQEGTLYVNEGDLLSNYEQMASGIIAFQVTNVRLGIIDTDQNLLVKEGNLRAEWVALADDVQAFQLADYRIVLRGRDDTFKIKEGNLYERWNELLIVNLKDVAINGGMPVYLR
jgi:hypothetical protein